MHLQSNKLLVLYSEIKHKYLVELAVLVLTRATWQYLMLFDENRLEQQALGYMLILLGNISPVAMFLCGVLF